MSRVLFNYGHERILIGILSGMNPKIRVTILEIVVLTQFATFKTSQSVAVYLDSPTTSQMGVPERAR